MRIRLVLCCLYDWMLSIFSDIVLSSQDGCCCMAGRLLKVLCLDRLSHRVLSVCCQLMGKMVPIGGGMLPRRLCRSICQLLFCKSSRLDVLFLSNNICIWSSISIPVVCIVCGG